MILNSIDKQLQLAEDGQISWQKDLTNPMPGEPVAMIKKGEGLLSPSCSLIETPLLEGLDKGDVLKFIQEWLRRNVQSVLEPLFKLQEEDVAEGAAREVASKLHDALGILPRGDLEELIAKMEEEQRASLRSKKIRFGPLLVFLPELNKPVAVRLRALLLTLWNDKDLPADVPADGIVSFSIEGKEIDSDYYRSIGYPVYGPRSVRVDMLDRVVCAVYDGSKDGKFTAKHSMAEWLGSNISDLYAVLEAMGHKKIYDPADEPKPDVAEKVEEEKKDTSSSEPVEKSEDATVTTTVIVVEKEEQKKPDLATFKLKKGKAIESKPKHSFKPDKKKFKPKGKKSKVKKLPRERIYTAEVEAKPEDSPFAILQQLKTSNKD